MGDDVKRSQIVTDAVDYKGFPADKTKTGGWVQAALILGIEISERLSTMGISVNLVTYLHYVMHLPSSTSANIVTDFMGTCYILSLFGGFVADTFLGRYKTIVVFAIIQTMGTILLAITASLKQLHPPPCHSPGGVNCQPANDFQMGMLYLSLYVMALGTGGLKSSVSGFGTDQFDEKDEKENTQMTNFFHRFFFFISIGTLVAVTILVYIQDEIGRSIGYGICSITMIIAIIIFYSGTKRYRYKKCSGSPLVQTLQVFVAAIRKFNMSHPDDPSTLYEDSPPSARINHTKQFQFLDRAAIIADGDLRNSSGPNPWKLCTVTHIEEVKMMLSLLPVWATTIMFWTTHAQMITFSVEQASTMDRHAGKFLVPSGSLVVYFVSAILLTLGLYDRVIVPLWKKLRGNHGFSSLQKIAIGLVMSILGMSAAAVVEMKRLSVAKSMPNRASYNVPLSVFVLIPQFFIVGSGEGLIYTGQLNFFLTQSPKSMKTMSTGLFLTTISLGFFMSSFLVGAVKKLTSGGRGNGWMADNINYGRLDLFYWLLAVLGFINLFLYLLSAAWYRRRRAAIQKMMAMH